MSILLKKKTYPEKFRVEVERGENSKNFEKSRWKIVPRWRSAAAVRRSPHVKDAFQRSGGGPPQSLRRSPRRGQNLRKFLQSTKLNQNQKYLKLKQKLLKQGNKSSKKSPKTWYKCSFKVIELDFYNLEEVEGNGH